MANLKQQKIFYLSLIVILLVTLGYTSYYLLGGFEAREVIKAGPEKRNIVGKSFKGFYKHPDLEKIWVENLELLKSGSVPGTLAVINYKHDTLDNDEIHQFIGIAIEGGMAEIPMGFEVKELKMDRRLMIPLTMHPLVRPSPRTIEDMFNEFAALDGDQLGQYTLELHFEDNSMMVEIPIIE